MIASDFSGFPIWTAATKRSKTTALAVIFWSAEACRSKTNGLPHLLPRSGSLPRGFPPPIWSAEALLPQIPPGRASQAPRGSPSHMGVRLLDSPEKKHNQNTQPERRKSRTTRLGRGFLRSSVRSEKGRLTLARVGYSRQTRQQFLSKSDSPNGPTGLRREHHEHGST